MKNISYKKSDFNGFERSFKAYCEWYHAQDVEENKISWIEWWERLE